MALQVKIFRLNKKQFGNMSEMVKIIENDPDFKSTGLAKVNNQRHKTTIKNIYFERSVKKV